jgi:hypothetical protein
VCPAEGFFALVKFGVRGVHHAFSAEWLQGYVNEYACRYNHGEDGGARFRALSLRAVVRCGRRRPGCPASSHRSSTPPDPYGEHRQPGHSVVDRLRLLPIDRRSPVLAMHGTI